MKASSRFHANIIEDPAESRWFAVFIYPDFSILYESKSFYFNFPQEVKLRLIF